MESYTLALDVHAELQQQGCSMKAAGWLESAYREELEQELEKQFGGVWIIRGEMAEDNWPEEATGENLNEIFAKVAENIFYELKIKE